MNRRPLAISLNYSLQGPTKNRPSITIEFTMRYSTILVIVALVVCGLLSTHEAQSFSFQTISSRHVTYLDAANQDHSGRRRKFLDAMKRVFIGGTGAALWNRGVSGAFAEDSPAAGKIVDVQVSNLDGESGNTGIIRIQLKPEWAPRGVSRFEVNTNKRWLPEPRHRLTRHICMLMFRRNL
jgi:hypothetical protein